MTTRRPALPPRSALSFLLDPPGSAPLARGATAEAVDDHFLELAVAEAWKGVGRTAPNPPVGAVVVKGRRVVGAGYHRRAGLPHAEVEAFDDAGVGASRGATLYVTLEPCNHHGRTPPCTERILEEGVRRVVVGCPDPNPRVDGRGIRRLRAAGVEVTVRRKGPLAERCRALIAPFAHRLTRGRPWVVAKVAATLDGRVAAAGGDARWVTGPEARALVHLVRDRVDAILVGSGTARTDDPELTVRTRAGRAARNPRRVLVDGQLQVPASARLYAEHKQDGGRRPLVLHTRDAGDGGAGPLVAGALDRAGVKRLAFPGSRVPLDDGLAALAAHDVDTVLVEPGPGLLAALLDADLIDELWWFTAPALVGADGIAALGPRGIRQMAEATRLVPLAGPRAIGPDSLLVAGRAR